MIRRPTIPLFLLAAVPLGLAPRAVAQEGAPTAEPPATETPAAETPAAQAPAAEPETSAQRSFSDAAATVRQDLRDSTEELSRLYEQLAQEKIPLNSRLDELQLELTSVREEYQQVVRVLEQRTLDLTNLRKRIDSRTEEIDYLSGLLSDYVRNFRPALQRAEDARWAEPLEAAELAPENTSLTQHEVFAVQTRLLDASIDRLEDALGGTRFDGRAVDAGGTVREGTFALLGPLALFRSTDGAAVGTAEARLGSQEPAVVPFAKPEDAAAAERVVLDGKGLFPLDPTLGSAHKIEATERQSIVEEIEAGGVVMYPIFALAGTALLVAVLKWLGMLFTRQPSRRRIRALLDAVRRRDEGQAQALARKLKGPVGRMLAVGVDHLREPRDLVEEVMYERVLTARLRLQRFLPFIAVCAASAPLLGLLGTVTGIIRTFKLITEFGSGDVRMLSSGISEALITTKYGLIVAVPSLLIHAFLWRKARGIVSKMETAAVSFANEVERAGFGGGRGPAAPAAAPAGAVAPDPRLVREQVGEILGELLGPIADDELTPAPARARGGTNSGAVPTVTAGSD